MAERLAAKVPKAEMIIRDPSEEAKRIHVVKHLPRTDEEVLEGLMAKNNE